MAYGFVAQSDAFTSASGTTQTISPTLGAGESVIACTLHTGGGANTHSVSDGTSTFTKQGSETNDASGQRGVFHYLHAHPGGSVTLTATLSIAASNRTLFYARYTGLANSAPQTHIYRGQAQTAGADGMTSTNLTPSSQPAMLFGIVNDGTSSFALSAGTGFSDRGTLAARVSGFADTNRVEDIRLTSTSAVSATWTSASGGGSEDWIGAIIFGEAPTSTAPVITQQPGSLAINAGDYWYGQVVATDGGSPPVTYQAQINTGSGWSNIGGATAASYASAALTVADSGTQYRWNVTNAIGTTTTAAATVTVIAARSGSLGQFDPGMRIEGWW
jgi:hypothetical protein